MLVRKCDICRKEIETWIKLDAVIATDRNRPISNPSRMHIPGLGHKELCADCFSDIGKQIEAKSMRIRDKINEYDMLIRMEEDEIAEIIASHFGIPKSDVCLYHDYEFIHRGDDKKRRDFIYSIVDLRNQKKETNGENADA